MRRVVHLSLRRLNTVPEQRPCTQFDVHYEDRRKEHAFKAPPLAHPRAMRTGDVMEGMKPEDVLAIIGAPDFTDSSVWYYDIDAQNPYTLSVWWGKDGVKVIRRQHPPHWQTELWDEEIVY